VAVYRRSSRPRFVLLLLVLTAITLVTIDARSHGGGVTGAIRARTQDVFSPIQSATHAVLRPVGNFFTGVFEYGSLKRENAKLADELAQARNQAASASEYQRELQILSEQQNLDWLGKIPTVTAQVVENSSSNFEVAVQINRGTNSGIAVGMPVVTGGGLVGRVVETSASVSTVLLLTDPSFSVGVILANGTVLVADGQGRGNAMTLELVDATTAIHQGDKLMTSGLNLEQFPKDIPVATVKAVRSSPGQLQQEVTVTPTANVSHLEYVRVLQWSPQS
jgi:rod shape-determining protein MreC